jgi:hypothetical protein
MRISNTVLILSGLFLTLGCSGAPVAQAPLTGRSFEIQISDAAHPEVITVKTDDEVKWVNTTGSLLELSVEKPLSAGYSCRNGFADEKIGDFVGGSPYGGSNPDIVLVATLKSNHSVSLCFSDSGIYNYSARRIIVEPGKQETTLSGTVMVK